MFAVERATDAFETFRANLLHGSGRHQFKWPAWLEQKAHPIEDVLEQHRDDLEKLRGKVDLIAGGPPCQGFSFAGKRNASDPRNKMFERYVSFVDIIRPKFLVLENVPGMKVAHATRASRAAKPGKTYYEKLLEALNALGYTAGGMILDASNYGVPQRRARLVVIGMRDDIGKQLEAGYTGTFEKIAAEGKKQLHEYGGGKPVTAEQAISDLAIINRATIEYTGLGSRKGYFQVKYTGPSRSAYQNLMHLGMEPDAMDSMRLANHSEEVLERFKMILKRCRRGVNLSSEDRERLRMLKHRTVPMSALQPAPTLTTLPDDILHYSDPRILTVRECARIQSFPDWFVFKGKYTTGGNLRRVECPRYTQVGNAVPPLLARAIGVGMLESWRDVCEVTTRKLADISLDNTKIKRSVRIGR